MRGKKIKIVLISRPALLLTGALFALGGLVSGAKTEARSQKIVRISGDQAKAISVALEDFEKRLAAESRSASDAVSTSLRDIRNYDVSARTQGDGYSVVFSLKPPPRKLMVARGAKRYQIGNDYQIKDFVGEK